MLIKLHLWMMSSAYARFGGLLRQVTLMLPALVWERGREKELSRPFKVFYAKCPCGDGESEGITPDGRVDSNIFGLVGGSVLVLGQVGLVGIAVKPQEAADQL